MTDTLQFKASKVYVWIQVAQLNDTSDDGGGGAGTGISNSRTSITVDTGHKLSNGMTVLIDSEEVTISNCDSSTDTAITIDRAETGTSAATHLDNAPIYAWWEVTDATNTQSLVQSLTITDEIYKPMMLQLVLSNFSLTTKFSVGELDGVITEGVPIKVLEGATNTVLFSGDIARVTKQHALEEGNTLQIAAYDALHELGRTKIVGDDAEVLLKDGGGSAADISTYKYSEIIKLLVQRFQYSGINTTENNITFTEPTSGSEPRFEPSRYVRPATDRNDRVTFASSDTSVLKAIQRMALADQITTNGFGYTFYVDPNFTKTSTAHKPAAFFNYYKTSFMPHQDESTSISTGKITFQNYFESDPVTENGSTRLIKSGASFDNLDVDKANVINVRFRDPNTGRIRNLEFEIFWYSAYSVATSHFSTAYSGKKIIADSHDTAGVHGAHDPKLNAGTPTDFAARLIDTDENVIGYVQYASSTSAGFLLVSGSNTKTATSKVVAGENLWLNKKASNDYITLTSVTDVEAGKQFRPQEALEQKIMVNMDFGLESSHDNIRQAVAARVAQKGDPKVRGRIQISNNYPQTTFEHQVLAADTLATSAIGSLTKTEWTDAVLAAGGGLTDGGDGHSSLTLFPQLGLRAGHVLAKLTGQHGTVDTYGYLEKVEANKLTVTLNSGTLSNNDYVRFHVPIRAGHMVKVRSTHHNIGDFTGGNCMVTSINYLESAGSAYTDIETLGLRSTSGQEIIGTERPELLNIDDSQNDDWQGHPFGFVNEPHFTGAFSVGDTGGNDKDRAINWLAGTLYIGNETYAIAADDSEDATYGINGLMGITDDDNDGMPDERYVIYFEPTVSTTRFAFATESNFEARNAIEGRNTASSLLLPFGQNRIKIGTAFASKSGANAKFNILIKSGLSTVTETGSARQNVPRPEFVIGGAQLSGDIDTHFVPTLTAAGADPVTDAGYDLGSTARNWRQIHAQDTSINAASDRRSKKNIKPSKLGLDFINDLNPVSFQWNSSETKHIEHGIIAQEVIEAMKKQGINDLEQFTGIRYDKKTKRYLGRYMQFMAPMMKAIQELSAKVEKLENEGEK